MRQGQHMSATYPPPHVYVVIEWPQNLGASHQICPKKIFHYYKGDIAESLRGFPIRFVQKDISVLLRWYCRKIANATFFHHKNNIAENSGVPIRFVRLQLCDWDGLVHNYWRMSTVLSLL